MVEILKQGKLPEEREYILNCTNCGCQFKIKQKEGKFSSDQRDGNILSYDCPTCGHFCCRSINNRDYNYWDR